MNNDALANFFPLLSSDWGVLLKILLVVILLVLVALAIYDRFIQRKNQLLINYPLIGRLRYLFYMLRGPMRQYFGDEKFYESFDKVKWVLNSAERKSPYASFSPEQPQKSARLSIKNANCVLNTEDVSSEFSVTFGTDVTKPFITKSVFGRSAMSDGAISPEGTRAFSIGAHKGSFPINTGEGGLTSNFLASLNIEDCTCTDYLEIKNGTIFSKVVYKMLRFLTNKEVSQRVYRKMIVRQKDRGSFIFDNKRLQYFRIDWTKDIDSFPKNIPSTVPDIIFQMGSGLYGVRNSEGHFDAVRYVKVMRFCCMTEVKLAQGAKQTGGKLLASKVSDDIAYYRGIPAHQDLISPNRFPYAKDMDTFFDFIAKLQELSDKPVGFKIVISNKENFEVYAKALKKRKEKGLSITDFITIDGGDGGSATAPLEMMSRIGLTIRESLIIVTEVLEAYGLKDEIKIIAAEKVLTPDDVVELLCYGADFINIARGFMISAGCIRARECSGAGGRNCPVGLATMDEGKRSKYLVLQKAKHVANYHNELLHGVQSLLAVMGKADISELSMDDLIMRTLNRF